MTVTINDYKNEMVRYKICLATLGTTWVKYMKTRNNKDLYSLKITKETEQLINVLFKYILDEKNDFDKKYLEFVEARKNGY